jgi:hypothetical protein
MNLSIFTVWDGNIAIDPARESEDTGPAQRKLATLPKGTSITVKGLVYRRCPWGVPVYYVCRAPQEKLTFDIATFDADKFVNWTAVRDETMHGKPAPRP